MSDLDLILDFWRAYDRLSEEGACDAVGGMESLRVFEEWLDAGSPRSLGEFIRCRANAWPTD